MSSTANVHKLLEHMGVSILYREPHGVKIKINIIIKFQNQNT